MALVRVAGLMAAGLAVFSAAPASAQYGYGGFSFRSPYVQVEVNPYGGTQVQTPYYRGNYGAIAPSIYPVPPIPPVPPPAVSYYGTIRGWPLPGGMVPAYVERGVIVGRPVLPDYTTQEYAKAAADELSLSRRDVYERLLASAEILTNSLQRHPQGESWLTFLDPAGVMEYAKLGLTEPSATSNFDRQMRKLLGHFEATTNSRDMAWVVRLSGFRETQRYLDLALRASGQNDSSVMEPTPAVSPVPNAVPAPPAPGLNVPGAEARGDDVPPPIPVPPRDPNSRLEELPAPEPVPTRGSI